MKLNCKSYNELSKVVGNKSELSFDDDLAVFKTTKGSFVVEHNGKFVLGLTPSNEVIVMPEENVQLTRNKINQFLPNNVKLTSKKNVLYLNDRELKKYNIVSSDGTVLMEE